MSWAVISVRTRRNGKKERGSRSNMNFSRPFEVVAEEELEKNRLEQVKESTESSVF